MAGASLLYSWRDAGMKRFLSIDFDYFLDCTAKNRAELFPKMDETFTLEAQNALWQEAYVRAPERLARVGINQDYKLVEAICKGFQGAVKVENSHKYIYTWIMEETTAEEAFAVYNIDFHHDMYCLRLPGEKVNCGNWAQVLREQRPGMQYYWVKREDSEVMVLGGKVDATVISLESLQELTFDYIYLCHSRVWSPPHLDEYFTHLHMILK